MRKLLIFITLTVLCSTLAIVAARYSVANQFSQSTSTKIPYTAFRTITNRDSSGKQLAIRELIVGQRSDGSYVSFTASQDNKAVNHSTVVDLQARKEFVVDEPTKSITSYPLSDKAIAFERARSNGDCIHATGEHAVKLGYDTVKIVKRAKDPTTLNGVDLIEVWQAPAVGCLSLDETHTFMPSKNVSTPSEIITDHVTKVMEGEPADKYFAEPIGFVERKPSEVLQEQIHLNPGRSCPKCELNTYGRFDKVYQAAQQQK